MTRLETIIAVDNVTKSSQWYQALLSLQGIHGGNTFEMLADKNGTVILCLHRWGEHEHPTMRDPNIAIGNGLILYIRVKDLKKVWNNALKLKADIHQEPYLNSNSGQNQFS